MRTCNNPPDPVESHATNFAARVITAPGLLFLLQVLTMGFTGPTETVVTGVNDPARDVRSVQNAVHRGVLLYGHTGQSLKRRGTLSGTFPETPSSAWKTIAMKEGRVGFWICLQPGIPPGHRKSLS